ncbi:hypothetical protein AB1L88_01235 [Tautonia sp. JC769]|uniref:hypothetical protein n=1 Tax=Tautonia sp. JC769 TaxID=3232135 RepID=UPI00345ADECD
MMTRPAPESDAAAPVSRRNVMRIGRATLALAGLTALLSPLSMGRRVRSFQSSAAKYAAMEKACSEALARNEQEFARWKRAERGLLSEGDAESAFMSSQRAAWSSGAIEWSRELGSFAGLMRRKYQRAARRPWEPVPADPPEPPIEYPNERHAPPELVWAPAGDHQCREAIVGLATARRDAYVARVRSEQAS